MRTKFAKSFVTIFFPVGDDIRAVVVDWVNYLRHDKLWGLDDPLFPMTKVAVGTNLRFAAAGLDRRHWSSAGPIRATFKDAFARAGLPYFNPHSFRKTLALAWSQNLGHDHVLTTFSSYGGWAFFIVAVDYKIGSRIWVLPTAISRDLADKFITPFAIYNDQESRLASLSVLSVGLYALQSHFTPALGANRSRRRLDAKLVASRLVRAF